MAVAAKKHVTIFARSRHAPGAGSAAIKSRFASAAHGTKGIKDRMERNARIAAAFGR